MSLRLPGALPCLLPPSLSFPSPGVGCPALPLSPPFSTSSAWSYSFLVLEPRAPCGSLPGGWLPVSSTASRPGWQTWKELWHWHSRLPFPSLSSTEVSSMCEPFPAYQVVGRKDEQGVKDLGRVSAFGPLLPLSSALAPSTTYTEPPVLVGIQRWNKTLTLPWRSSWLAWGLRWESAKALHHTLSLMRWVTKAKGP